MSPIPTELARTHIQWLHTTCSLSLGGLEECANRMAPARCYTLCVAPALEQLAYILVKQMGALTQRNPFAPFINVELRDNLGRTGWYIQGVPGEAWGSEGL